MRHETGTFVVIAMLVSALVGTADTLAAREGGATLAPSAGPAACGGAGNRDYVFEGRLRVIGAHDGAAKDLAGVQLRVVREKSPVRGLQGFHATTDADGEFEIECTFARDRNGAAPGGRKIRFAIQARFRNDDLRVRKGGWGKNNWFTIANRRGCHRSGGAFKAPECLEFSFDDIDVDLSTDDLKGKHAYVWWFYTTVMDTLAARGLGTGERPLFRRQLTVTYPDRHIKNWWSKVRGKDTNSFFIFNVHLEPGDWDDRRTMLHELMHRWDVAYTRGTASLVCLFDAHHKSPERWGSSRCSGFMEGFAEASAWALRRVHFGGPALTPLTHWEMRTADPGWLDFEIDTLDEAERTDVGWMNFLAFLWTGYEFAPFSSADPGWCNPSDVSFYEVLEAIAAERPRKASWLVNGEATFDWFTDVLVRRVDGFDDWDARFYELLGDPALTATEIRDEMCGGALATGTLTIDDEWSRTSSRGVGNAVVIAGPATYNGENPGVVRIRRAGSGPEIRFQEWSYRETEHGDTDHTDETVSTLVVEEGRHEMDDGSVWLAGTFPLDGTKRWRRHDFGEGLPGEPTLLLTVQTYHGGDPVTVRARDVSATGFEAALFEEEGLDDGHVTETVGFLAIYGPAPAGQVSFGSETIDYAMLSPTLDHEWTRIGGGMELQLDEETSVDDETRHVSEDTHVLRLGRRGVFAQPVTDNGMDPFTIRVRR